MVVAAPLRRRPTLGLGAGLGAEDMAPGAEDWALGGEGGPALCAGPAGEELLALRAAEELPLSTKVAPGEGDPCPAVGEGSGGTGSSLDPDGLVKGSP